MVSMVSVSLVSVSQKPETAVFPFTQPNSLPQVSKGPSDKAFISLSVQVLIKSLFNITVFNVYNTHCSLNIF